MMLELDFSPITEPEREAAPALRPEQSFEPIVPVPEGAPPPDFHNEELGQATASYAYRNAAGRLMGYMANFEDERRPLTYCTDGFESEWRWKGLPAPHPIYNIPDLFERPNDPVLLVSGEQAAEAAKQLFPQFVVTTCPYGYGLADKSDWSPLKGRTVVLCPDYSDEAESFIEKISYQVAKVRPESIRNLPPERIAESIWRDGSRINRPDIPIGWNLILAPKEGWTAETIAATVGDIDALAMTPMPLVLDGLGKPTFRMTSHGVEALVEKYDMDGVLRSSKWVWLCDRVDLVAHTRNLEGENWGRKFRFKDRDGQIKELIIPDTGLAGEGNQIRERLVYSGLSINTSRAGRELFLKYLDASSTEDRVFAVDRIGWHDDSVFVTSTESIGKHPSGQPIEFAGVDKSKVGAVAGTLENWQERVAKPSMGNSRLIVALSTAFAAPLLALTGAESGGIHFYGSSSVGKTTALRVAASVWGGGGIGGYISTWRATDNALEGVAKAHFDALLCLDELGQATARAVDAATYMLTNGIGKSRGARNGGNRDSLAWRTMILSSGEVTIATKITEDGTSRKPAAGQLVRFIEFNADAGQGFGLFDIVPQGATADDFANALKDATDENYGCAGLAFVKHLAEDVITAQTIAKAKMADFLKKLALPDDTDGQVKRVARKMALIAAAGEMAIEAKVLPWEAKDASKAVKLMFGQWVEQRGGFGSFEERDAIEIVRSFIQQHGSIKVNDDKYIDRFVRFGFRKEHEKAGTLFCFYPNSWHNDVCRGKDARRIAEILDKHGVLHRNGTEFSAVVKQKGGTQSMRVYAIKDDILYVPKPGTLSTLFEPEASKPKRSVEGDTLLQKLRDLEFGNHVNDIE